MLKRLQNGEQVLSLDNFVESVAVTNISGASSALTATQIGNAGGVLVVCSVATHIAVGTAPTATTASAIAPADMPVFVSCAVGDKLATLRVGANNGVMSIYGA